ncbi:RDD family protein [Corynebacterium sp. TAE3-ERU12]|uniref:RDD family protein n=1 Tax=Corynebacterium sp. TAE3-ERU12 TaxID=2849491 RepID=UPI001C461D72|nr:RDD family protein [Corynebacterium sp. TAE3-ERU12]MBV7295831.1 RDD family protein [Corynebacterium sp. TAE3-ERU12]
MAEKRSWLEGPEIRGARENPAAPSEYPGQDLGLSRNGAGSQASLGRRVGALLIDWVISVLLTSLFYPLFGPDPAQVAQYGDPFIAWQSFVATWTFFIFFFLGTITGWLFARTPGHMLLGMGVARVDHPERRVGLWRAAVRTFLTLLLLPPVIQDTDLRGMHDRATGTTVIRVR